MDPCKPVEPPPVTPTTTIPVILVEEEEEVNSSNKPNLNPAEKSKQHNSELTSTPTIVSAKHGSPSSPEFLVKANSSVAPLPTAGPRKPRVRQVSSRYLQTPLPSANPATAAGRASKSQSRLALANARKAPVLVETSGATQAPPPQAPKIKEHEKSTQGPRKSTSIVPKPQKSKSSASSPNEKPRNPRIPLSLSNPTSPVAKSGLLKPPSVVQREVGTSTKKQPMGSESVKGKPTSAPSSPRQQEGETAVFSAPMKSESGTPGLRAQDLETLAMVAHCRELQWRFVLERRREGEEKREKDAESQLWQALEYTKNLREKVAEVEEEIRQLELTRRAGIFLEAQGELLDQWHRTKSQHTNYVSEALQAMKNSTLRVPLLRGAQGDVESIQTSLTSAENLLRVISGPVNKMLPTVECLANQLTELSKIAMEEQSYILESSELMERLSHSELQERSLRSHLIQLMREKSI